MPANDHLKHWAAIGILLVVLCGLFWEAILTERVMSQADVLLTKAPWSAAAPGEAPYVAEAM